MCLLKIFSFLFLGLQDRQGLGGEGEVEGSESAPSGRFCCRGRIQGGHRPLRRRGKEWHSRRKDG